MKKFWILIMFLFVLTSCWKEEIVVNEKKDFIIDTKMISEFNSNHTIEKVWKVDSNQNITLSSQANGRVSRISVRQGDPVLQGQVVAVLSDTVANYWLSLERAKNALDRAEINYDSTKINLDKSVFDSQQAVDRAKSNLDALIKDTAENIKKAQTDLDNTNISLWDSKWALEIQKLVNSIEKAELDYDNKIIADNETLESFKSTVKKEYNSMVIFLWDIIEFSDTLYGVTDLNNDENDKIDTYLWAKNTKQKFDTKKMIREIIDFNNDIYSQINIENINTQEELTSVLDKINTAYTLSKNLLNEVEKTLNFSIASISSLSQMDIANYNASVNWYQASLQWNYTWFLAFDNSVKSFLRTYLNAQESILKSIDLMKKDLEIVKKSYKVNSDLAEVGFNKTIINSDDAIASMEIQLKSAQNTLDNAKKSRDVTLRSLQNAIDEARIGYKTALNEFNKLTITSPINGTISEIMVDAWQEINIGTPMFKIANNLKWEVEISLTDTELKYVKNNSEVEVLIWDKVQSGMITSISNSASTNLWYSAIVSLENNVDVVGNIVKVKIPVSIDNLLLPVRLIETIWWGQAQIKTFSGGVLENNIVELGQIWGNNIEILPGYDENMMLITSEIKNYDPNKYNLKVNQPESE